MRLRNITRPHSNGTGSWQGGRTPHAASSSFVIDRKSRDRNTLFTGSIRSRSRTSFEFLASLALVNVCGARHDKQGSNHADHEFVLEHQANRKRHLGHGQELAVLTISTTCTHATGVSPT